MVKLLRVEITDEVLGIIITFSDHYDFLVSKTCKMFGFVTRATKEFKNPKTI